MKPQLTLEAFADWCEKQPADKAYDYWSYEFCACGQYATSLGLSTAEWKRAFDKQSHRPRGGFWWDANYAACLAGTFGDLAQRLRAQIGAV